MTKSTITREQLLEIIETDHVQCGEASYLARMALAAMDSEPNRNPVLAYADSYRDMEKQGVESVPIWSVITDLERNIAPLYRHAQQPVVPDGNFYTETQKKVLLEAANVLVTRKPTVTHGYLIREVGRIAIRALGRPQPAPVVPDDVLKALQKVARIRIDMDGFDGDRRGIADCLCDAEEALIEVVNRRAAMLAAAPTSIPIISDRWIPVSERMPEDRTQVILWDAEIGEVTSGHYSHKTQTFYHCGDTIENEITHWMPTPAAPQEVKP